MSSNGSEPTLHVDAHRALARLDPSRGVHRILAGERRLDVERGEAALGQCGGRHFDENALLLQPQQVDFGDAGHPQQDVARLLREGLELGVAETLAGNGVKRDVGVAEFVIEERPEHALGQSLANVADLLACLVEGVLDGLSAHRALQVDEDVAEARAACRSGRNRDPAFPAACARSCRPLGPAFPRSSRRATAPAPPWCET